MTPHQRFRRGEIVESLAVRKDKTTGELYSRVTDIQRTFPGASLFKVNGVVLNYLEDEDEQEYEPKRIAHCPDAIIDIISPKLEYASSRLDPSISDLIKVQTSSGRNDDQSALLLTDNTELSVSSLSLQSPVPPPPANANALVKTTSSFSTNHVALQSVSIARPMAALSAIALDITHIQHQLGRSTDQQSAYHQQLLERLVQLFEEQAASKAREEKMLQEQAESKVRDERMLKMQQETIDRLIVNQQRVDALLIQNYELHEYPIPRLFVVLPDSFSDWDPRNILMERFRLHFLCECGNDCRSSDAHGTTSSQLSITAGNSTNLIPIRNSIHLARHEGYELSRPTEFFDRYGPYVLRILKILQHCLAVAVVAAPVAALADNGIKDITEGVKSISESTIKVVDISINILETKLGDTDANDGLATSTSSDQEDNTMLENLAALEGADLRRLDTFLRNNDQDKILGNLYRITTEKGHVKWVCFEHYKEKYRATALASFIQSVETAGGAYDPHLGQVTIILKSSTASKDFFRRLVSQAPAVQTLDVTLGWDFRSADLTTLVDMVAKSNIKVVKLDLQDDHNSTSRITSLRPGKGRYHSLLGLLSNTKLRGLQLFNLYLLATRTSNLPSSFAALWLQSFQFFGRINAEDRIRLTNIISHCSQLVDLKLVCQGWGYMNLELHQAAFSLKKLKRLHLTGWYPEVNWYGVEEIVLEDPRPMTEVIYCILFNDNQYLTKVIRQSSVALEVLVLYPSYGERTIDITSGTASFTPHLVGSEKTPSESLPSHLHLSALTHLDVQVPLTDDSLQYLSSLLPHLDLIHFGCSKPTHELLRHCNLASLKSLSILEVHTFDLVPILDAIIDGTGALSGGRLEQLFLHGVTSTSDVPTRFLQCIPLTRLFLDVVYSEPLAQLLEVVGLSKLEKLSIRCSNYSRSTEKALAKRIDEFREPLVIQLDEYCYKMYTGDGGGSRKTEGSLELLPRHRVTRMDDGNIVEHHYRFLQPILPVYSF